MDTSVTGVAPRGGEVALIGSGTAMIAVSFGLARYGYGLLLPDIRAELRLSSGTLGLIGTGAYLAYLLATVAVSLLASRGSPRSPVLVGGALATGGMALLSEARSAVVLAAGVLIAGMSAGLVYPPFSDLVHRVVPAPGRPRALSIISSGTGWGVLLAGPVALAAGASWRLVWLVFAAVAAAVTILAALLLPGRPTTTANSGPDQLARLSWSWFVCPRSGPLLAGAFLVGLGSSVFWTFAPDLATSAAGRADAGRLLLTAVGVSSILAGLTGALLERVDGRTAVPVTALALAAAMGLLAVAPASGAATVTAALLFGVAFNVLIAVQAIWSQVVFASRPTTGLGAVSTMVGLGLLLGPAVAGLAADALGLPAVFAAAAVLVALVAVLLPREQLVASGTSGSAA